MRPIIGLTINDRPLQPKPEADLDKDYPPQRMQDLAQGYIDAILVAGGLPILIPALPAPHDSTALLATLHGVLITGGNDLHPQTYHEAPDGAILDHVSHERDLTEIALARHALSHQIPLLGICRGQQVLNVALGGTLFQDMKGHSLDPVQGEEQLHPIQATEGSRLQAWIGSQSDLVNSYHHQAVKQLGAGLVATAYAEDGTIEAIEAPDHPFAVAVQWHPEVRLGDPVSQAIFQAFVQACQA